MTPPDAPATTATPAKPPATRHAPGDGDIGPSHRPPQRGLVATLRKYVKIFRASLVERMTYRGDFLFGTILRFLPLVTTILLWQAIYAGSGQTQLAGFRYREMIAYLLLTNISRMFSSMPGLAGGIAREIREGTLKRYLIQPVDMVGYLLVYRVAHKAAYIIASFLPYVLLFVVCRGYFDGFRYREMIAYLLLTHISRMFSSMPGLAAGIARDIREGTLKRYMIQPVDMIGYLLAYRVAHKVAYIVTSAVPYGLLFFVCRGFFDGLPDPTTLAAYAVSLVLSFLVGFFFEASVGMVGFWFLEVTSLLYIVMTLTFFISGQMFPLDLLPQPWAGLLKVLPFQYMAYFPAVIFLGKVRGQSLVFHLLGELFWAVFFIALTRGLYRLGLRRYSAFGG